MSAPRLRLVKTAPVLTQLPRAGHDHPHAPPPAVQAAALTTWTLLSAPVWQRILLILPILGLLWAGVWWALRQGAV